MINIPRWKKILIVAVCVLSVLYSMPNAFSEKARGWMAENLPSWMPSQTVNLGLDLRGGSHLLLQVDLDTVMKERTDDLVSSVRPELRKKKIGYTRIGSTADGIRVTLKSASDADAVKKVIADFDNQLEISVQDDILEGRFTETAVKEIKDQTIGQSIEIVRRRIDETGTNEPVIQRQGEDRILVQLPGVDDPQRIKDLLGTTAKLTFHLVDMETGVAEQGSSASTMVLPIVGEPGQTLAVERDARLTGDLLTNAQYAQDQNGQPAVSFRFNGTGAKKFCDLSKENVNKLFAIVLDKEIISAPVIREPICGGSGQISGSFTLKEATDLALLLRAGALPAPLKILEERSVGPSLGSDSVEAGKKACLMAIVFVAIFAMSAYGLFGVFAAIGLLVNITMIVAVMSMIQATLTLPGIAGIVLTIGLAVDGNVLVFERIKEELRAGRSIISAIDTGYVRARTTITDSNVTALIAALILFSFGTGPIKGFAVTMCIGVATSYFCALMLTRLIILSWVRWKKPKIITV